MELRNIITFLKIASLGSYSKAAQSLGYAQSTLTAQMQSLENDLNVKLIEKSGRGIKLTDKGEIFLKYAEKINVLINESKEAVVDNKKTIGTLKIGVIESVCNSKLPKILKLFHTKYSDVNIELKIAICSRAKEMLKQNMVDVILIIDEKVEDEQFITHFFEKEPMSVLCSPNNKLTAKNEIKICDLKDERLILTEKGCSYRKEFENTLKENSISTDLVMESGSIEAIKGFVKSNIGITFLPRAIVKNELANKELFELKLSEGKFNMYYQVLYNKNKYVTNAMKAFLQLIK